jgi:predicted DNA-binding transcriptional regulator YafY
MLARMGRILGLLRAHPGGLTTEELLERVGYGDGPRASRLRTLNRDLAALAADGWRIDTLPTANTPARRVLRTVDNRFATLFTDAERAQLARAAACAGPGVADALADDLGRSAAEPAFVSTGLDGLGRLGVCQTAVADRCTVTFTYNGSDRLVYPVRVLLRAGGWYLRALDTGDNKVKQFSIDRMRRLRKGPPGTSPAIPDTGAAPVWDQMRIRVHDPITVTVDTTEEFLPDVLSALAAWGHELVESADPDRIRVQVPVTNSGALLVRLIGLGTRVRLVGPEDVRDALRTRLLAVGGAR